MNRLRDSLEKLLAFRQKILIYCNYPEFLHVKKNKTLKNNSLKLAMEWLLRAQDAVDVGGVAANFDLVKKKWGNPYRETTGYIISTFLNYAKISGQIEFEERAVKMGEWEISDQMEDGSFGELAELSQGLKSGLTKKVFNTGQVILGLMTLFRHTKNKKYLNSAVRAADWLVKIQDKKGTWTKHTTQGPKTYHARVDWALLEVYRQTKNKEYLRSALANLNWVIEQQNSQGWFDNCSLADQERPWTHLIAYTIRGLLESAEIMQSDKYFSSALLGADSLLAVFNENVNFMPGTFDKNWQSKDKYSCLTGDMQIAIIWLRLFKITGKPIYKTAAKRMIKLVENTQISESKKSEIVGGIAGSFPIDGQYCDYAILNWATKFFADTIMYLDNPEIKLSA